MDLPRNYNRRLQHAYPDLRMRWAEDGSERWLLERRANFRRVPPDPNKYPRDAIDTFIRHRDGFYLVGFYEPRSLPPVDRLVTFLRSQDTARMDLGPGTPEEQAVRIAEKFEEREREQSRKNKEDQSFYHSGAGGELYDRLAWEEGRRVAVPGTLPEE